MYNHLTSQQRSQIFAYKQCDKSPKFIAEALNVHISTIYRELARNQNKRGGYAHNAHEMAMERQERVVKNATISKKTKFECLQHIRVDDWSPEQISGVMKTKGIGVSHTTIYEWVKEDKLAGGTLFEHLRHKGHRRKKIHTKVPLHATYLTAHLSRNVRQKLTGSALGIGKWI